MAYLWKNENGNSCLCCDERKILTIPAMADASDSFEELGEGAWRWTRKTGKPVTEMKMLVAQEEDMSYWQVPSVNYNGNGWGSGAQYSGYDYEGTPWTYAWHRVAIPACTYAESEKWAVSLFGEEKGGMSCSIWAEEGKGRQALLWPEQEGPKVLFKRSWMEPFMGTMEPTDTFVGILYVTPVSEKRVSYFKLMDFAWKYFDRPVKMHFSPEEIIKLDTLYFRTLWHKQFDGVTGFANGYHWVESEAAFVKHLTFEIGWVGQNASVACTLLREYINTGDEDLRDKALSVLDSWVKYAFLPNGLMFVRLMCNPAKLDSIVNGDIPMVLDACNLGTAATYFFKAAKLAEKAGCPRPEYNEKAIGLCDFAVRTQRPNGEFAKSWFIDGTIDSPHGSVGAFFCLPLFDAYELTGDKKYLDSALKSVDFYCSEFHDSGVTTAGALDSFCIDKESAAPVLRAALRAYHATNDKKYLDWAEEVAYYLATWQWHYSTQFPEDSMLKKSDFDTYGCTAVSAAHNALDFYGIYYVPEYLELAKLTGNDVWRSRGRALWYNGMMLISDGTLVINNRVRPIGSQDESARHTRWSRPDKRIFVSSEWLTNWQGTFRQVALDMLDNWDELR